MKILKKTLAVALVLVLALGMVPIMTSASDYTDDAQIEYKEEVEVLTGIGVLEGYEGGAFQPGRNVTRAQACAIVARLLLTRKVADSLPVDSTGFKDVPISHWAANYIAFCVSQEIVVGYGDGRFGPNNDVKGSEFAIMIMRALGIGDAKRWEGANWQMFAILDGQNFGILTTGVNYTAPATREETAVYAFRGLLHSPSGKDSEKILGIVEYEIVEDDGSFYLRPVYGMITVDVVASDSIAKSVYPTLTKEADERDDLGRPSRIWFFGKPAKPISIANATPVTIIEGNVTQGALFTATGEGRAKQAEIAAVVNQAGGQKPATLTSFRNGTGTADGVIYDLAAAPTGTVNAGSRGRGNITEIYKVGDEYIAVVIVPSFAKLTNIESKAAAGGTGAYTLYTIDKDNTGKIFTAAESGYDTDTLEIEGTVAKGDWVLYYKGEENLYINAVDTLTGVLSSVTSAGVYTVDGEALRLAQAYQKVDRDPAASKDEQTFYVDAQKNILGVAKSAAPAAQIAFVFGVNSYAVLEDGKVVTKYDADIVDISGKATTVPVVRTAASPAVGYDQLKPVEIATDEYEPSPNMGRPYLYEINPTSGAYTFKPIAAPHAANQIKEIEKGSVNLTELSGTVKNANNSTIFALINFEDGEPNGDVTPYNRNTVPSFDSLTKTWAVSIGGDDPANSVADIVYIFDDVYGAESSSLVFLLSSYTATTAGRVYNMVVKGEIVTLTVPLGTAVETHVANIKLGVLWMSVGLNSKGEVEYGDTVDDYIAVPNPDIVAYEETALYYEGGLLMRDDDDGTGAKVIGEISDTPIYIFEIPTPGGTTSGGQPKDPGAAEFDTIDAEDLDEELEGADVAYVVYNKANDIIAVYILFYV